MDEVLLEKSKIIERCVIRIHSLYQHHENQIDTDFDRQDALVLNILRACEASIDGAMHLARTRKLGLPSTAAESFALVAEKGLINSELATELQNMVGFRNIAVHSYQSMNLTVLHLIAREKHKDLSRWASKLIELA